MSTRATETVVEDLEVLRKRSRRLNAADIKARRGTVRDMEKVLEATGGIGLAAIQVGIPEAFFIVSRPFKDACFNPEVLAVLGPDETGTEGCLSLGGGEERYDVSRPGIIRVRYTTAAGKDRERTLEGLGARVFQHELDHLSGTLICDRGTPVQE